MFCTAVPTNGSKASDGVTWFDVQNSGPKMPIFMSIPLLMATSEISKWVPSINSQGKPPDPHFLSHLDRHQVFSHLYGAGVCLSRANHHIFLRRAVEQEDVRKDRKFRLHLGKHLPRLLRGRVISQDLLHLL